jgi:uncharacterized repeat protein (TIGR03803 family)
MPLVAFVQFAHKSSARKRAGLVVLLYIATATASPAQIIFKTLLNFSYSNYAPYMSLVQGRDGNFYGTTVYGGANHYDGTVFKITPDGTLTTLYSFCAQKGCTDGAGPYGGLILATDGNFYGTTVFGGANGNGTFFKITPGGTLTTLLSFYGTTSYGALVQATDGNFYGTTVNGGNHRCDCGTVFKVTPEGTLATLHKFDGSDGANPYAGLVLAADGNFYGTTLGNGNSTVFKISPRGLLTTLHRFDGTDGSEVFAGLIQAKNGNFYGTAGRGGAHGDGTVFKISSRGALATLHNFDGPDGAYPYAGLAQATDGNFYGTTTAGGANGNGTIFKISSRGGLTTLHRFDGTDGDTPGNALLQATDGIFYGTTEFGGTNGLGTVFSLSVGLDPFVAFVRDAGEIGQIVGILGQGFAGTTNVSFNGIPANFAVRSDTYLTATVPDGATSGFVTVTTTSDTLTSNKAFRVMR